MSAAIVNGLYRTSIPLPGNEAVIPSGRLVYFHKHPDHEKPIVQLPIGNKNNRWMFDNRGLLVQDDSWHKTLVQLQQEGFYQISKPISLPGGTVLPVGLLVQLTYSQAGEPAIFPAELTDENAIKFMQQGTLISDLQVRNLEACTFKLAVRGPAPAASAPAAGNNNTNGAANGAAGN